MKRYDFRTASGYAKGEENINGCYVSYEDAQAEIDRLNLALTDCVDAVENTKWGYDGDCGLLSRICNIIDAAQEES